MILQLGSSMEFIRVTAEYSNAVLLAMLPYVSDFAQKLELPVPHPITVDDVVGCAVLPWRNKDGGIAGGAIRIKGGWRFGFSFGYANSFSSPNCYTGLQDPDQVPKYFGTVRMTTAEAVALARDSIKKLGIPLAHLFAEQDPRIPQLETVGTNVVPRYRIEWIDPVGARTAEVEVNADAGRTETLSIRSPHLERPPPKVNVVPPRNNGFVPYRPPTINPAYAWKLMPIVLQAVDDYGAKLGLSVPRPLTTNHAVRFELHDNGGWPHAELELTNGWRFIYRNSMVNGYYAPDNLFSSDRRPKLLKDLVGKWNMTEAEAIELIRRTLAKLNYPTNLVLMDFQPRVSQPALPGIPRYWIYWWAENDAHDDLQCKVEAEVDAEKRELKSLYYDHVAYWNHPPPIDVPLSLPPLPDANAMPTKSPRSEASPRPPLRPLAPIKRP